LATGDPKRFARNKKAGLVKHAEVIDQAGLLFDEPPGMSEMPFV